MAVFTLGCLLLALLLFPDVAYAYVDLGTGSIVVQAAIAGILGALFWIKIKWRQIVQFVKRLTSEKDKKTSGR